MTALTFSAATLRRLLRDRTALFFIVILPIAVILLIGITVRGNGQLRVGLVAQGTGPLATQVGADLRRSEALEVTRFSSVTQARTALRRVEVTAFVVVPSDFDARLHSGSRADVVYYARGGGTDGQAAISAVSAAVAATAARVQAARFAAPLAGSLDAGFAAADRAAAVLPAITVRTRSVDARSNILPLGFSYSAPTMLVLFVFINAFTSGAAIIETRRLGVYSRALAAPIRSATIVLGETIGYLALALLQSALIVAVGALAFGVSWGDPLAATVLVGTWAVVGTGAGVLAGTLFRTPEQASSIAPAVGMAAGMLGGCMWPLEIVPPVMRTIGHVLPHAWAVDAWTTLLSRGGDLGDITRQLAVLAAFAVGLLVIATWRMRRRLT